MRIPALHQRARHAALLLIVLSTALSGQDRPASVVSWRDLQLTATFGVAATLVMPADRELQKVAQRDWVQRSPAFQRGAQFFNGYGSPGVVAGAGALYLAGWAADRPDISRMGLRTSEAIVLSGVITGAIKGMAGRTRPYASPAKPYDFHWMGGRNDGRRQSFPSGHTTAAFAFASALEREVRVSHPQEAYWAAPLLYGAATLTGLARMHSNNHWGSDVILGAGIGLVSGIVVSRFHAERPAHWIDRRLLPRRR